MEDDGIDGVEDFDDLDVSGPTAAATDARQAGDDAVDGLDKITAQMSGGEHRPEQQEMCRAVAEALVTRTHLVVQAGTGTGKSLAYLVPAALSGKKVVVATATKALQDQLAEKDLPLVDAGLGLPVPLDFAVLKGRSNYVCRQRVAEVGSGGIQAELGDQGSARADEAGAGARRRGSGAPRRHRATRGHRRGSAPAGGVVADVGQRGPGRPELRALRPGLEHGQRRPAGVPRRLQLPLGRALLRRGRPRPGRRSADVVVVNTHLYGAHLASGGAVLPEHDVVIFDEAHELEEVMTSSLGVEVTPGRFRSLVTSARSAGRANATRDLLDSLASVGDQLGTLLGDRVGTRGPARRGPATRRRPRAGRAARPGRRDQPARHRRAAAHAGAQRSLPRRRRRGPPTPTAPAARPARLQAAAHLAEDLHRLVSRTDGEVAWVDGTRRNVRLRLSPIDVGPVLAAMLWGEVTSVLTSATIPPRIVERVGLEAFPTEELNVGSPFDYRSHALLYVARHLPDRRAAGAEEALHEELAQLLEAAGGRTLALFTSRRATEAAAAALAPELPYTLLLQGDLPKSRLLEEFARDETSCLFATMGFWQGVDIPGRALSLVTIDRLPFPRPDDPLLQARRDRAGGRAFSVVDLPRAATMLAQGSGRLIRNADDRGVVAVLDPRLATASYRGVLLAMLPPMRRSVDISEVETFLRRALEEGG